VRLGKFKIILCPKIPAAAVLDILRKAAFQLFGDDETAFTVDVTTLDGDFFPKLTINELGRYFLIFKNVINSITLLEKSGARRSIVLYLNTAPNIHDLSFSITTNDTDEYDVMEIFVQNLRPNTRYARIFYLKMILSHPNSLTFLRNCPVLFWKIRLSTLKFIRIMMRYWCFRAMMRQASTYSLN